MVAHWKQALLQSLEKNSKAPFSKFFQLATVRPDGRPANRTVVYRGFEDETYQLLFTTHSRSRKIEDFEKQPWGEICWYFTETQEQYRLGGHMKVIDEESTGKDQQVREENWGTMSTSLRVWFAGLPPTAPKSDSPQEDKEPSSKSDPPVSDFAVVRMDVGEVDYLDLQKNVRQLYLRDGVDWKKQDLNP